MKNSVHIIIQETDDDFRTQFEKELTADAGFVLVRSVKSFHSFKIKAHSLSADVIILNWHYPTHELFDFIAKSKKNNPKTKVLVTFDFVQPDFVFKSLMCGADGFLIKPFSVKEIQRASSQLPNKKLQLHLDRLQ